MPLFIWCRQNSLGQLRGFWPLRFYPLPPILLADHTKAKMLFTFQFKKQGSKLLDISIKIVHFYHICQILHLVHSCSRIYCMISPFSHFEKSLKSQSQAHEWMSCVDSCKIWLTSQYSSTLKFSTILIQTNLFCVQRTATQQKQRL